MEEEAVPNFESKIKDAMRSRVGYFKEQADSLTFEGVRRLLEKDLALETYALDVHKRFIKQCLSECLGGADDDNGTKNSGKDVETSVCSTRGETTESCDGLQSKRDEKEASSEDENKAEGSPVLGLLTGHKPTKFETEEIQDNGNKEVLSESMIKKAIRRRVSYFKDNSENVTMAGVRRLLEEDLKLDKNTLDPYKKFISEQLDKVLKSLQDSKPATGVKKKNLKKTSQSKASKEISSEESSDSLNGDSEEADEEVKPKKRIAPKGKTQNSDGLKKRKRPVKETKEASKKGVKRVKPADAMKEDNSDAEDDGNVSDDSHSHSSAEKPVKKKEVPTPAYGKRVEHLKTVIKSCGMSVPPVVYKKVKQVPENKREASLIKELEEILSKEGLSADPSEKEIKEVRKRKERAKELEGIDMSNIVSSSRRRSTGFVVPPKPKIPVESDGDEAEDSDNDEDTDEENDDDNDDDNDGDDGSQSDELDEDDEDSD